MLTPSPQRSEAERVLDEGRRMYSRSGQERLRLQRTHSPQMPSKRAVIWFLLEDAMRTNRLLPDRERTWLLSANRSQWPEIARTAKERWEVEREQITEGIDPGLPRNGHQGELDPGAVNRFFVALDWRKYIRARTTVTADENWALLLRLASGVPPKRLRDDVEHRGMSRNMVNSIKIRCLRQIEAGLEADNLV